MQHRDTTLRESLLQQLEVLVRMIKVHIRPYLPHIFQMIRDVWPECLSPLLILVEAIAEVCKACTACTGGLACPSCARLALACVWCGPL